MHDDEHLYFDASSVGFVLWHHLKGVKNKSIRKSAKYKSEIERLASYHGPLRERLETISEGFDLKYICALMNSTFAKEWLAGKRRSKRHIYPDDWKTLPIPIADERIQKTIGLKVNEIADRLSKGKVIVDIEKKLDDIINKLYQVKLE